MTDDPDKAWRVMAWTAMEQERLKESSGQKMTGRKLAKPVFAYSLSWHTEQTPDRNHMLAAASRSLEFLGLTEHQTLIVAHRDTDHRHVHIIVNRVHPLTGLAGDNGNSKYKLSDFAMAYEKEHGKIFCKQREENQEKRARGENAKYRDQIILDAWRRSDNGAGFAAALKEKGYELAQGRKRIVIVDKYAQTHNPTRHLENVKAKDFTNRLRDLNLTALPDATKLAKQKSEDNMKRYKASLAHDRWASEKVASIQDRHNAERSATFNDYHDRVVKTRDELNKFYRFRDQQKEIDALKKKTAKASIWKKLIGLDKREKSQLEKLQLNFENAKWRALEGIGKSEKERQAALDKLQKHQTTEKRFELKNIEKQKPEGYADAAEREKILKHSLAAAAATPTPKRSMGR
jgi:hypothetical protein